MTDGGAEIRPEDRRRSPTSTRDGNGADGKPVALPQPRDGILQAAFATDQGQTSPLSELGDDGYYLVHVDKVTPADDGRSPTCTTRSVAAWQAEQQPAALQKLADDDRRSDVNGGKSLKDVAAAHKLTLVTTAAARRAPATSRGAARPGRQAVRRQAERRGQRARPATAWSSRSSSRSSPPIRQGPTPAVKQLTDELSGEMQTDMLGEFNQSLRETFPGHDQSGQSRSRDADLSRHASLARFRRFRSAAARAGKPVLVWTTLVADLETPVSAMLKLADGRPNSFLFESVEGGATIGRYSFIGLKPDLIWRCFGDRAEINRQRAHRSRRVRAAGRRRARLACARSSPNAASRRRRRCRRWPRASSAIWATTWSG